MMTPSRRFISCLAACSTLLTACGASAAATPAPTLVGQWQGTVGAERTFTMTLKSTTGKALRGEATLPALGWVDAGRFQVQGQWKKVGTSELKLLDAAGKWVYDLSCQPDQAAGANRWSCVLETWRSQDRMSASRAWKVSLQAASSR